MANATDSRNERNEPQRMAGYLFTCPDCGQEIEVNESMRDATITHGCPVCGASVSSTHFDGQ